MLGDRVSRKTITRLLISYIYSSIQNSSTLYIQQLIRLYIDLFYTDLLYIDLFNIHLLHIDLLYIYVEKSPGLFIQTAYYLYKYYHPFIRFTVIGNGILLLSLQNLTKQLQIFHLFDFVGYISTKKLPFYLSSIDIIINTSLWPETFCISNIEAMSMMIPIITFAVGGNVYYYYHHYKYHHSHHHIT